MVAAGTMGMDWSSRMDSNKRDPMIGSERRWDNAERVHATSGGIGSYEEMRRIRSRGKIVSESRALYLCCSA